MKKKNTRDYGKFHPRFKRYEDGGSVEDSGEGGGSFASDGSFDSDGSFSGGSFNPDGSFDTDGKRHTSYLGKKMKVAGREG